MDRRASAWSVWLAFLHKSSTCFLKLNILSKAMPSSFSYSLSITVEFLIVTVALDYLSTNIVRRNLSSFSFKQFSENHFATKVSSVSSCLTIVSRVGWHAKIVYHQHSYR